MYFSRETCSKLMRMIYYYSFSSYGCWVHFFVLFFGFFNSGDTSWSQFLMQAKRLE